MKSGSFEDKEEIKLLNKKNPKSKNVMIQDESTLDNSSSGNGVVT